MDFCCFGRLRSGKGYELAIEAMRLMREQEDSLSFVGTGPIEPDLKRRLPLSNVYFHGHQSDPERLLKLMDVFIFPYLQDQQDSAALMQTLRYRKIYVASDLPVFSDKPCILFRAGNAQALAAAMWDIALDIGCQESWLVQHYMPSVSKYCEQHGISKSARQYLDLYSKLQP